MKLLESGGMLEITHAAMKSPDVTNVYTLYIEYSIALVRAQRSHSKVSVLLRIWYLTLSDNAAFVGRGPIIHLHSRRVLSFQRPVQ